MNKTAWFCSLLLIGTLVGCDNAQPEDTPPSQQTEANATASRPQINEDLREALGKVDIAMAIEVCDEEALKEALAKQGKLSGLYNGYSYASLCVFADFPEGIPLLAKAGYDLNTLDAVNGVAALHHAVDNPRNAPKPEKSFELVDALVENGADVNIRGRSKDNDLIEGLTPLYLTVLRTLRDQSEGALLAATLLNHGADPDLMPKDSYGQLPAVLPSLNPDKLAPNGEGQTPILSLAIAHQFQLVELFAEHGANVNATREDGLTPLFCTIAGPASSGDQAAMDAARTLLAHGAEPDATLNRTPLRGCTPLMIVATSGNLELFNLLLEAGADPYATTQTGMSVGKAVRLEGTPAIRRAYERHVK